MLRLVLTSNGANAMTDVHLPSERHFRLHRRQWLIYLLGCTAMAIGTIVAVIIPGENPEYVLVPTGTLFVLMFALGFVERARRKTEFEREMKRIQQDEWTQRSLDRSVGKGLLTVILAQPPMIFFMAYVPPKPSVVGMGCLTTALGCGAVAASYLYYTRASSDE